MTEAGVSEDRSRKSEEGRAEALTYMPIFLSNHVVQGFIHAGK